MRSTAAVYDELRGREAGKRMVGRGVAGDLGRLRPRKIHAGRLCFMKVLVFCKDDKTTWVRSCSALVGSSFPKVDTEMRAPCVRADLNMT